MEIGNQVCVARWGYVDEWMPCPTCFGKKTLTVILGDDSREVIDCATCASGFEPPKGVVKTTKRAPVVEHCTITGIESEQRDGKLYMRYRAGSYMLDAENVFLTDAGAMERAQIIAAIETRAQEDYQFNQKKNQARTWAWNVHYYRQQIKDAERQIEIYTEKLHRALPKVKADKTKCET